MSYFFIANIRIHDHDEYQKYVNRAADVFSKYNGRYLAVDNNPEVLEGDWNYTKTVIISFETKQDFDDWYNSDEYQKILRFRLSAAMCDSTLVKGLEH